MTTQPSSPPKLVLHTAADVAASVPYLLGFAPSDSAVIVFFDVSYRHALTVRVDWPLGSPSHPQVEWIDLIVQTCQNAAENSADRAQVVLYPPTSAPLSASRQVAGVIRETLSGLPVALHCVGTVSAGLWRDLTDPKALAEPLDDAGLSAACQWVANGVAYQPDRETVVAGIDGEPTQTSARILRLYEQGPVANDPRDLSTAVKRRAVEEAIFNELFPDGLHAVSGPGRDALALPPDAQLLQWALALGDRRIREPLLWRFAQTYGDETAEASRAVKQALSGLTQLVRHTPEVIVAPLASCAAALAWQLGNGAVAQIAAERGLRGDRGNVLCDLVFKAVEQGVHPRVWVDMLQSMTLRELRAGRARGEQAHRSAPKSVRDCPG